MTSENDTMQLMHKLETIKDIRQKTMQAEKLRTRLRSEWNAREQEDKCLEEYRAEMELLLQEKMAHVEELRLIHADINLLEATIKQAEEERNRAAESAKKTYTEYIPVKQQLDHMRAGMGLERMPNLKEETDQFSHELLERHALKMDSASSSQPITEPIPPPPSLHHPPHHPHPHHHHPSDHPVLLPPHHHAHHPHPFLVAASASTSVQTMGSKATAAPPTNTASTSSARDPPTHSAFRQQPPPMKACLSCHQQIHRNAPICPLCKAKSRSRNPKKPKRKLDE